MTNGGSAGFPPVPRGAWDSDAFDQVMQEGETLRLVVLARLGRPYRRSGSAVVTSQRFLFFSDSSQVPILDARAGDLAVKPPDQDGAEVMVGSHGRPLRIRCATADANIRLGSALERLVLGHDHAEVVTDAFYLGGHGNSLEVGRGYTLVFGEQVISALQSDGTAVWAVSLEALVEVDVSGPGAYTSGGGFIGGGFGLGSAVEGMLIAGVANELTTRRRVRSVIALGATDSAGFFEHRSLTPEALRIRLSAVVSRLGRGERNVDAAPRLAAELRELAELRDQGVLTADEFVLAKKRLLS